MDGGYLVPKSVVNQSTALLSLGLGDDWTFDQDWKNIKPVDPIHMYDGTVTRDSLEVKINRDLRQQLDIKKMYDEFFQGTTCHYKENVTHDNFVACLDRLESDSIFIKMDIEGGEFEILQDILDNRNCITGIAMEIHNCNKQRERFHDTVKQIKEFYKLVHVHGNNHTKEDKNGMNDCMELSFVRNDLCSSNEIRYQVWVEGLDYPNTPTNDDRQYYFET
jgi:hypothetical protein